MPRALAWLPVGLRPPTGDPEPLTPMERPRRLLIAAAFLMWILVVGVGLGNLWAYAQTPGPAARASETWPSAAHLARDERRPTLVVFAHPQCPCSRATIGELSLLMTHAQQSVTTYVVFYRPSEAAAGWEETDLWRSAAAIPGVQVLPDEGGAEASAFGAATSGQTLLYDAGGRLIFRGGITSARGHSGDNAGRSAVLSLLHHGGSATSQTSVFGCLLGNPRTD
jgi:hypothetical protein